MALERTVRWVSWSGPGVEHLVLRETAESIMADGIVVGDRGGTAYGLRYQIVLRRDWTVVIAEVSPAGGRPLVLRSDGAGNWTDGEGRPVVGLSGCIDIDLAATPFTNTLPIRRLNLAEGEARDLTVAYVPMPTLLPRAVVQRYTALQPGRLYRYDGIFRNFSAVLEVDADGLVIDYPETFRRLPDSAETGL
jgi:hypothetical protein